MSFQQIIVDKYSYDPRNLVGQGSFASVYKGTRILDNVDVAIKKIKINEMNNRMSKLWSEIKLMKNIDHPNILKLYDVHLDMESEVMYLFLEWCEDGELNAIKQRLTEQEIRCYLKQIKNGLEYLYYQQIMHRDLKPQNILLHKGVAKICDFGLSILADKNTMITTMCGSPLYMAPEVLSHENYTTKSDLWSFGVIMYELLYGKHPYKSDNYHQLTINIRKSIHYPLEVVISDSCMNLLIDLLTHDPKKRIGWVDFLKHSWFTIDLDIKREKFGGEYKFDEDSIEDALFSMSIERNQENCQTINLNDGSEYSSDDSYDDEYFSADEELTKRISSESLPIPKNNNPRNQNKKQNFSLSDYLVKDYCGVPQSAPNLCNSFGVSYSPNGSSRSVGSQFYKCLSKSYKVLKKI
jgi:serine/threonine protein kinase